MTRSQSLLPLCSPPQSLSSLWGDDTHGCRKPQKGRRRKYQGERSQTRDWVHPPLNCPPGTGGFKNVGLLWTKHLTSTYYLLFKTLGMPVQVYPDKNPTSTINSLISRRRGSGSSKTSRSKFFVFFFPSDS